jgi:hypothetical protein
MTAQKNELSNRENSELELTSEELDRVSGGLRGNFTEACAMVAEAKAQAIVKIGTR